MRLFSCQACGQVLYFENTTCVRCGRHTGYFAEFDRLLTLTPDGATWVAHSEPDTRYRFCANWEISACNWLVAADGDTPFCRACRHNQIIPDLSDAARLSAWRRVEAAKRRLLYTLLKLGLPMDPPGSGSREPLVFRILADEPGARVLTGHADGVITIALREANDAIREDLRTEMNEPYRTLLGHFRHETGHYFWDLLVRDGGRLEEFRSLFGDERADYETARLTYYAHGAPAGWQAGYVSEYATMHAWEDFAETWAHYLHIVDTLEMAQAFGLTVSPRIPGGEALGTHGEVDPYDGSVTTQALIEAWLPVTFAVNSLNRSMGQPDLYPFVISPGVLPKLDFVRRLVADHASEARHGAQSARTSAPRPSPMMT